MKKFLPILSLLLFGALSSFAQRTWDGGAATNNWGDAANWSGDAVPIATDAVTLINNTTVNLNVPGVAASVTFPAGANNVTLNITTSLTVTGAITIPRAGGGALNTLAVGAGTLTAGSIAFTAGGNAVRHIMTISTGTVTVTNVTQVGSTGSASITFTGAGLLQIGGTFLTAATGTLTPGGTGTVSYTAAGAQTVGNFTYTNLTLTGSGAKTTTGVIIGATGRLSMQGTATITAAPTYTAGATLEYAGSGAQTSTNTEFAAAGGPTNLIINNTNGVTLHAARTITALTLTNGNLIIPTASTRLTITTTNAIGGSGFDATKCIVTQVNTGTGATAFVRVSLPAAGARTIPVGDGTNYLPVTLTPANANSFDVCAFNGITANGTPNGTAFSPSQKSFVVDAVWVVNLTAGATGAGVTMTTNWPETLEGAVFSTNPDARIGISRYGGATWDNVTGTGSQAGNTATRTAITLFSPFGVGGINKPLPIAIQYFNAAKGNGYNTLSWQASCSSDKAVFEIERSTDGRNFTTINTVTATREQCAQSVSYVDNTILTGTVFYRIKSVDVSGKAVYSVIIKLGGTQSDIKLAGILPNPVMNTAQLNIVTAKKDYVNLSIVSMEGKLVHRSTVQLQAGSSIISLDVTNLQKGLYIIKGVFADGEASSIKFVKQ
jgi:hypothetical protein